MQILSLDSSAFYRKEAPEAEKFLTLALAGMLQKEGAYQTAFFVDWIRFISAIIVAEQMLNRPVSTK